MQHCLLCQREKPDDAFDRDRASCRQCLGRDRELGPPNYGEYDPYIQYAKQQWPTEQEEAESIALVEIVEAEKLFDPSNGLSLEAYTRLRIHNAIANAKRKKRPVPWTSLGIPPDEEGNDVGMDAVPAQPDEERPDLEAEQQVRTWLMVSELFGEPLTFESAKAHFGQHDPLVGNAKKFGHAMKAMGYVARRRKIGGRLVRVYEKGIRLPDPKTIDSEGADPSPPFAA